VAAVVKPPLTVLQALEILVDTKIACNKITGAVASVELLQLDLLQ
jgi:hypothetical protein